MSELIPVPSAFPILIFDPCSLILDAANLLLNSHLISALVLCHA